MTDWLDVAKVLQDEADWHARCARTNRQLRHAKDACFYQEKSAMMYAAARLAYYKSQHDRRMEEAVAEWKRRVLSNDPFDPLTALTTIQAPRKASPQ